jgi:hypothetical protein
MAQELYDVEERAKRFSVREREDLLDREGRPVWRRIRQLLHSEAALAMLPKEKFAEALGYLRNPWDALQAYLSDGRLPIAVAAASLAQCLCRRRTVRPRRRNWLTPEGLVPQD